jgi:hypothetical protein
MSEVRHQLLITLVHGTWARGFFPRLVRFKKWVRELRGQSSEPPPFWFEEGSYFWTRLTTELGDISHKITPLPWTGKNSISERDKTTHVLAKHLSAEHADQPQATQLIIAHSHGGNIALRALHQLRRDASQLSGGEKQTRLVVTLATPFVEVHHADFGRRPDRIRQASLYAMIFLAIWILQPLLHLAPLGSVNHSAITIISFAVGVVIAGFLRRSIGRRAPARQGRVEALMDATRLGEIASAQAQRLLVIRAIDDEASLTMALGAVFTYVTARAISYILGVFSVLALIFFFISLWVEWHSTTLVVGFTALTMMLLGPLAAARTVHGWGLALSPMECQINTQSTPDAKGLSAIVTLVRRTYVKSLRHGIYDHEDCAKTISDWVRSQLCMPHEVGVEGNSVYRTGIAN